MNSEENRVREICRQARVIASRKQRDAFLSSACGLNRALLSKVETMLAAESVAGTSLKPSAGSDQSHTVVVSRRNHVSCLLAYWRVAVSVASMASLRDIWPRR